MPRKPIIRSNEHFYHVTARSNNKENFFISKDSMWFFLANELGQLQKDFEIKIGCLVLMDNHFHLLIQTPKEDIDRVMYFLMKRLTSKIQRSSGRINKIFGGRYKGCLIENHAYLLSAYKYIYRNPIAAGITEKAETYEYSTLNRYLFKKYLPFEFEPIFLDMCLSWINNAFEADEVTSIKRGLKKTSFKISKSKKKI